MIFSFFKKHLRSLLLVYAIFVFAVSVSAEDVLPPIDIPQPVAVKSVKLTTLPAKTRYFVGDDFSPDGGVITVEYDNGTKKEVKLSSSYCSGFDSSSEKELTITVSYLGFTDTFSVSVREPRVQSVTMTSLPTKRQYFVGDAFSPDGGIITVKKDDGSSEKVKLTAAMCKGFTSTAAGEVTVTATYLGYDMPFSVTVKEPRVTKLEVTSAPAKALYYTGDAFDSSGLVIHAIYDNGDKKNVTEDSVLSGFDSATEGAKTLTVTYTSDGQSFSVTIKIKVVKLEIAKVEIASLPTKSVYTEGEVFSPAGLTFNFIYNSGKTEKMDYADIGDVKFGEFDSETLGKKKVTVTCLGYNFEIEVEVRLSENHVHRESELIRDVEPTCESDGFAYTVCTVCGTVVSEQVLPALPHAWNGWVTDRAPSGEEEGHRSHTCLMCGKTEEETMGKLVSVLECDGFFAALPDGEYFPFGTSFKASNHFADLAELTVSSFAEIADAAGAGAPFAAFRIEFFDEYGNSLTFENVTFSFPIAGEEYSDITLFANGNQSKHSFGDGKISFCADSDAVVFVAGNLPEPAPVPSETTNAQSNGAAKGSSAAFTAAMIAVSVVAVAIMLALLYVHVIKKYY